MKFTISFDCSLEELASLRQFMAQNALGNAMEDAINDELSKQEDEQFEQATSEIPEAYIQRAAQELGTSAQNVRDFLNSKGITCLAEFFAHPDVPEEYKEKARQLLNL